MNVQIQTDTKITTYPFFSPDLFAGAPLMICGISDKKIGPHSFFFKANDLSGNEVSMSLPNDDKIQDFPTEYLSAYYQLDALIGLSWLTGEKKHTKQAIDLSLAWNLPCPFTQTITGATKGQ